jgi:hypothetical protein
MADQLSRRDFPQPVVIAGASLALPGVLALPPASEANPSSGKTLDGLLTELGQVFGRFTKWRVRCKEQNATTEAVLIRLAEEVLAEPCTGTVAEGHSHWLRLNGAQSIPCPYPYTPKAFAKKQREIQSRCGGTT